MTWWMVAIVVVSGIVATGAAAFAVGLWGLGGFRDGDRGKPY